jgi:hypothetical protein
MARVREVEIGRCLQLGGMIDKALAQRVIQ